MSKNRNFFQNIFYTLFPEKIKITNLNTNKTTILNTHYEIIRNSITIGTYITFFLITHNPNHVINLLCDFL